MRNLTRGVTWSNLYSRRPFWLHVKNRWGRDENEFGCTNEATVVSVVEVMATQTWAVPVEVEKSGEIQDLFKRWDGNSLTLDWPWVWGRVRCGEFLGGFWQVPSAKGSSVCWERNCWRSTRGEAVRFLEFILTVEFAMPAERQSKYLPIWSTEKWF